MEQDWNSVAQTVEQELYRRSLSSQALADRAGVDRKTVDRIRRGERVRMQTLSWVQEALGVPLIDMLHGGSGLGANGRNGFAPQDLGGYTRENFQNYEGDYIGYRRSFDHRDKIICYHLNVFWDSTASCLAFRERQENIGRGGKRYDYEFKGKIAIPAGIGVLHFLVIGGGAARLATTTLLRGAEERYMKGLLVALNEVVDVGFYPVVSPLYLLKQEHRMTDAEIMAEIGSYDADKIARPGVLEGLSDATERFFPEPSD